MPKSLPTSEAERTPSIPWYRRSWLFWLLFVIAVEIVGVFCANAARANPVMWSHVREYAYPATILIPGIIVMLRPPVAPQKKRPIGLRILGCTILIWYLQMAVRAYLDQPVATALARARGDEMYDGVGGNVVVMVLGWVFGLMATLPLAGVAWLLDWYAERNRPTPPEP